MRRRLAGAYQPMLRALAVPGTVYFLFVTIAYLVIEEPVGKVLLGAESAIISLACLAISCECARRKLSYREIEQRSAVLYLLIFLNLVSHHMVHLEPAKIIFFALEILMVAVVMINARLVVGAVVLAGGAMMAFALQAGGDYPEQYTFILLAATFVAFIASSLTRKAIRKAIGASVVANELREAAEQRAERDTLTELPNRRRFFSDIEKRLKARKGTTPGFAVGIVDLDGFKSVNDRFGHSVGDQLLAEVATRLRETCGESGQVARLGGDEFALIVDDPRDGDALIGLGWNIRAAIERPFTIMSIPLRISASIGFTMEQGLMVMASELMDHADYALYRAKSHRSGVEIFSEQLEADRRERAAIEHNLRHGDLEEEIHVVFQPQVDIQTGETSGFEALARWSNPEMGPVPPDVFITAAERIGVMGRLTSLCLGKALEVARNWPPGITLSFNLSVLDIETPGAVDVIRRTVEESGFPPERIEFEVTETLIMADFERAVSSLGQLREMGARIALDDFGTGYASFGNIGQLNVDTIKIDRVFVNRLAEGGSAHDILKVLIDLCALLKVDCIVEGVETEKELHTLRGMGARYVQGYYFAKPLEAGEIAGYLLRTIAQRAANAPRAIAHRG